jgi:hypothetical protein
VWSRVLHRDRVRDLENLISLAAQLLCGSESAILGAVLMLQEGEAMRYASVVGSLVLLSAVSFSSCTCHEQVAEAPKFEAPTGFPAAKPSPFARAAAPTATPPATASPAEVGAAATPTVPAQIPKDFPKDVPLFKDAALAAVQDLANNAHNVIFTSTASVADISSFYQDQLTRAGWKIDQQFSRSNHAFARFQKGNLIANVTVAEDVHHPGQQVIAIMYEEQKPLDFDEF